MKKGGALLYGLGLIMSEMGKNDIIGYTDCDISVRLDQLGLLIYPLILDHKLIAIGTRRSNYSVTFEVEGIEELRAKEKALGIRRCFLDKVLKNISDTQCGFKLFHPGAIKVILRYAKDLGWVFDTEWLILGTYAGYAIVQQPIFWNDSVEESKTNVAVRMEMASDWVKQKERLIDEDTIASELGYKSGSTILQLTASQDINRRNNRDMSGNTILIGGGKRDKSSLEYGFRIQSDSRRITPGKSYR